MNKELVIHAGQLATMRGHGDGPLCGAHMRDYEVIQDGAMLIVDGKIVAIGQSEKLLQDAGEVVHQIDAAGCLVTPGLVDSHTHLVHGGSREFELAQKMQGVPYLDILAAGGGILSTVKATRTATFEELANKAQENLETMLAYGVTSLEAKSGYGLDYDTEVKQLQVVSHLRSKTKQRLVSTFLGAHAVPPEWMGNTDGYVNEVIDMVHRIAGKGLAQYCDVFCETGVFNLEQSRKILAAAKSDGLGLKIHADEIDPLGGAGLAAQMGATSADHLIAAKNDDLALMADAKVIPVALPGTSWYLRKPMARVRDMIDDFSLPVAIATDFNPGSCPTENLQLIMTYAGHLMKLQPMEILAAVTRNAAHAVGLSQEAGMLDVGRPADFVIWKAKNPEYVIYRYGINLVRDVFISGTQVVKEGALL